MFISQLDKGLAFRALHAGTDAFVIPNPWDAGTAKLLAALGFRALATTSAGLAFSLGRQDGGGLVSRAETIANAASIAAAVELPVAADLENGFGDDPSEVVETILAAAGAGLVGGSIEDATGNPLHPIYDFGLAVERVAAAAEAAHGLPFPFTFTARAENYLHGRPDLEDTIRRLQAFERVGADVLFAPGLPDLNCVRLVCAAVSKPLNVLAGAAFTVAELQVAGVRRISLGSGLSRIALAAFVRAAEDIAGTGAFDCLRSATPYGEMNRRMG